MSNARLDDFIRAIPKAELHVHIEGTLEPEMLFTLAERNGETLPFASPDECRAAYRFNDLQHFLDVYYAAVRVLRHRRDFVDLTRAYLTKAAADGVRHVEVFFDPQSHVSRGVPFGEVVDGIAAGLAAGERELGISWQLIMCILRDQPVEDAAAMLERALTYPDVIAGIGLDSAEADHPPGLFAAVFARARAAGLKAVAHAGEEGPAEYVRAALDELGAVRIDHGVRAADDPALVRRLADEHVPLTMCPLSNLRLQVTPDLTQHPLKRLLDAGVCVTVNSDDPAYFGGYVAANYQAACQALGLTREDVVKLARNSLLAAWLPEARRETLLAELDAFVAASR